jgi:TetR/AcrR family transcriptional regulator, transcriptional repressor for nem operon
MADSTRTSARKTIWFGKDLNARSMNNCGDSKVMPTLGQLRELSRCYLSTEHRDRPDAGCASAALLPEIGRQPRVIRKAYTARMRKLFEQLVRRLPQNSSCRTSHDTAIGIFSVLVGALQLARAVEDPFMSDAILAAGVRAANMLADTEEKL